MAQRAPVAAPTHACRSDRLRPQQALVISLTMWVPCFGSAQKKSHVLAVPMTMWVPCFGSPMLAVPKMQPRSRRCEGAPYRELRRGHLCVAAARSSLPALLGNGFRITRPRPPSFPPFAKCLLLRFAALFGQPLSALSSRKDRKQGQPGPPGEPQRAVCLWANPAAWSAGTRLLPLQPAPR